MVLIHLIHAQQGLFLSVLFSLLWCLTFDYRSDLLVAVLRRVEQGVGRVINVD